MTTSDTIPSPPATTPTDRTVTLSENAARQVARLIAAEGKEGLFLRLAVNVGGCSGFSYQFSLDSERTDEDHAFAAHGVTLVVDDSSLDKIVGCVLDYKTDLMGSAFVVSNPNATATCGCGTSFAA